MSGSMNYLMNIAPYGSQASNKFRFVEGLTEEEKRRTIQEIETNLNVDVVQISDVVYEMKKREFWSG